ncbi:hypothetical protein BKA57DRAFT_473504 [Linnemannia elongata]|nr:hypothetical protein BKA57DRAFT_473504 [Linnemannia elongata]
MHSPPALQLPEVLHLIACQLDVGSRFSCRQVCRFWSALFSPCVVESIDGHQWPWLCKWREREPERTRSDSAARTAFILEHKDHIRHLTLNNHWLQEIALQIKVTRLTSLTISFDGRLVDPPRPFNGLPELEQVLHLANWYYSPGPKSDRTRACWQLILNNPQLQSLRFMDNSYKNLYELAGKEHTIPCPEAISFLLDTLSRLPRLRHLMIANGMDDLLLHLIPTLLPHITSVEYKAAYSSGLDSLPPGHCATLRHLTIHTHILSHQVHTVLAAFPFLQTLSIPQFGGFRRHVIFTDDEIIDHPLLELSPPLLGPSLLHLGVRFTNLKTVGGFRRLQDHGALLSLLHVLPALEQLDVLEILESPRGENVPSPDDRDDRNIDNCPLRSLVIKKHALHPSRMTRLFSRMPHLVKLEVRYIPPEAVAEIARTCKSMEQLRFEVKQQCSKEINQLFVGCPKLKSLRGHSLAINIDDLLQGPNWTCFDLESLQCGVMDVPRLSKDEEDLLETMKKGPRQEPLKQEEQRILKKQRESWAVQGQILEHFARFKNLQHLDIGFLKLPHRQGDKRYGSRYYRISNALVPESLELSLASGLAHLASLHLLETFGLGETDYTVGENELERMFRFGGCVDGDHQYGNDILELRNRVKEIMPAVDILQGRQDRS